MLQENVRKTEEGHEPRRRWFSDEYFDLVVWQSAGDGIVGFQLCYDKDRAERAVSWTRSRGYGHFRVETGEDSPVKNMTPVLVSVGAPAKEPLLARFSEASRTLDPIIRDFILERLQEHSQWARCTHGALDWSVTRRATRRNGHDHADYLGKTPARLMESV